ncbi:MAG: DUF3526 domain-containing protein [Psychrobium sp.]
MKYYLNHLQREWRFLLGQKYIVALLLCTLLTSVFAVVSGIQEVAQQRDTIERLIAADEIDRKEAQQKHSDVGRLAYYSFHLTYAPPSDLAFAALGERDVAPWKHRIKMLALEGQIYETDAQNAELAQAGKIDFVFVISALSPLLIILLFHDLFSSERSSGRYDLLVSTTRSSSALWVARSIVRFVAVLLCLMLSFWVGAWYSAAPVMSVLVLSFWCVIYLLFWTLLSLWLGSKGNNSPSIASRLIGLWVVMAFIIPILGDLAIKHQVESPKGGDIIMTQREAVNDAWDLPKEVTMEAFVATHPQWREYATSQGMFEWKWYYAFQQVGDQKASELSQAYRDAAKTKYDRAGWVSLLSPPLLLQRKLTRLAETDAIASFVYEQDIREFHKKLRDFYYPWLFTSKTFSKDALTELPVFVPSMARANSAHSTSKEKVVK